MSVDDYERSLSFLWEACSGIEYVDGSMKLHAASPSLLYSNETVGEEHFLFLSRLFWTSFKPEIAWDGWKMVELQRKWNPLILWSKEKAFWIPENETAIVPDINDHLAAVHDRKFYIGKVFEIDYSNATISLYEYAGTLSIGSTFPKWGMKFGLTS